MSSQWALVARLRAFWNSKADLGTLTSNPSGDILQYVAAAESQLAELGILREHRGTFAVQDPLELRRPDAVIPSTQGATGVPPVVDLPETPPSRPLPHTASACPPVLRFSEGGSAAAPCSACKSQMGSSGSPTMSPPTISEVKDASQREPLTSVDSSN